MHKKNEKSSQGVLFLVTASSGAGKTTLVRESVSQLKQIYQIEHIITYTSKKPRSIEKNGIDYNFVTAEQFRELIAKNYFAEWSKAYDAYYGSPVSMLSKLEKGINCIIIVDRAGAIALKAAYRLSYIIMIQPPSFEILEQRLRERKTETEEQINKRLGLAKKELEEEQKMKIADYYVQNNDLEEGIDDFVECVKALIKRVF